MKRRTMVSDAWSRKFSLNIYNRVATNIIAFYTKIYNRTCYQHHCILSEHSKSDLVPTSLSSLSARGHSALSPRTLCTQKGLKLEDQLVATTAVTNTIVMSPILVEWDCVHWHGLPWEIVKPPVASYLICRTLQLPNNWEVVQLLKLNCQNDKLLCR